MYYYHRRETKIGKLWKLGTRTAIYREANVLCPLHVYRKEDQTHWCLSSHACKFTYAWIIACAATFEECSNYTKAMDELANEQLSTPPPGETVLAKDAIVGYAYRTALDRTVEILEKLPDGRVRVRLPSGTVIPIAGEVQLSTVTLVAPVTEGPSEELLPTPGEPPIPKTLRNPFKEGTWKWCIVETLRTKGACTLEVLADTAKTSGIGKGKSTGDPQEMVAFHIRKLRREGFRIQKLADGTFHLEE